MASLPDRPRLPVDDARAPLYSVGQVAGMLRLQQAFLRRLDEYDVVRPGRTSGGQRRYSREEISRVQYVVELIGEGMTLAGVRRVLQLEAEVRRLESELEATRRRIRDLEGRPRPRGRRAQVPPIT